MRARFPLIFVLIGSLVPSLVLAQGVTAAEILKRADSVLGPDGVYSFSVRVKDYQKSELTSENVYKVFSKNMQFTLVETVFPERLSGRKLLSAGGLWLFLPNIKRPTRVGMAQRLTGEVANGDLARTNFSKTYKATRLKTIAKNGNKIYHLMLAGREKAAPYPKIQLTVDAKTYAPIKANFYALSGKLLKTGEYSELEPVMGKDRITKLVIKDAVQAHRQSHLKYFDYKPEHLDDSFFDKESILE